MTSFEAGLFEIDAANPEEARANVASSCGLKPEQLQIVTAEAIRTWPWQPKRFHYKLSAPSDAETQDGSFSVDLRDGVVWLTLTSPEGEGKPVSLDEVLAESRSWPVEPLEKTALGPIVERATGKPESVALYTTPGSEAFQVFISPNALAAYVICGARPPEGGGSAEITAALEVAGVAHGVSQDLIGALLAEWKPGAAVVVARGEPPVSGANATTEQKFEQKSPPLTEQTVREDGGVDFFASQMTDSVHAGTELVVKQAATTGTEGRTVRGEALPTQDGMDLDLRRMVGKGVTISEDSTVIRAAVEGIPSFSHGTYSVTPALHIGEDVDFSTGNVDFLGGVIVNGEVQDGFQVRADGDITVHGTVGAATLEATGNVSLMNGMFGREKGSIIARGDVRATFLTECTVQAQGNVLVQREISRSTVTAGGSVVMSRGGKIIGGTVRAGREVSAEVVGSPTGRALTQIVIQPESGERDAAEGSGRPRVSVHGKVYPPTRISIGEGQLSIQEDTPYCMFVENNGQIVMLPYG